MIQDLRRLGTQSVSGLHCADYFATGRAVMVEGANKGPYYQKHWR
jgi:hypothetical protein